MLTVSEENYLKAIYKIMQNKGDSTVSTKELALEMGTAAASATDMIQRLAEKKFISYQKYYGLSLTKEGQKAALALLRKHRLWEVFLVEKLKFSWDEVHDIAEQLEHVHSIELVERLDSFLGYPKFDPHGDPIPNENGSFTYRSQSSLAHVGEPGSKVLVLGVRQHKPEFLRYLDSMHLKPGSSIEILDKTTYDQSIQLRNDRQFSFWISHQTALDIIVKTF
ncbi:MAG: metal-dependent transcriptional regulator [Saprospiraceae bacterium]|nr:metal-dependent transcriptional regulator [Saprospiraceae bacterium]